MNDLIDPAIVDAAIAATGWRPESYFREDFEAALAAAAPLIAAKALEEFVPERRQRLPTAEDLEKIHRAIGELNYVKPRRESM